MNTRSNDVDDHGDEFQDFSPELFHALAEPPSLTDAIESSDELNDLIRSLDPKEAIPVLAGMLVCPEMQANTIRFEALVNLAFGYASGSMQLSNDVLANLFTLLDGTLIDLYEDPVEDVFLSLVFDDERDYRVYEGVWEGNAFHLQRFVNVIKSFPDDEFFADIVSSTKALLTLSDSIANRLGHKRYSRGKESPQEAIPESVLETSGEHAKAVIFTHNDLDDLGIGLECLKAYVAGTSEDYDLSSQRLGQSYLDKYPILEYEDHIVVAMPTAIGCAIRHYIITQLAQRNLLGALQYSLGQDYLKLFHDTPILGGSFHMEASFVDVDGLGVAEAAVLVDSRVAFHYIFVLDDFKDYHDRGIAGTRIFDGDYLNDRIKKASAYYKSEYDGCQGVSVIVLCGWGRMMAGGIDKGDIVDWKIEYMSSYQLATLSWLPGFKPLSLWRLMEARSSLIERNVHLRNVNGLLNLYAWAMSLDHHLVSHADLPREYVGSSGPLFIMIDQNGLIEPRHKVLLSCDEHVIHDRICGSMLVRRNTQTHYFQEDYDQPIYVGYSDIKKRLLRCVYIGEQSRWWCTLLAPSQENFEYCHEFWVSMAQWLSRIANAIESRCPYIVKESISYVFKLEGDSPPENADLIDQFDTQELQNQLAVSINKDAKSVEIKISDQFLMGMCQPKNYAETALVKEIIESCFAMHDQPVPSEVIASLVKEVVPDEYARNMHMFLGRTYRDRVRDQLSGRPILIDRFDESTIKLGLGWATRSVSEGDSVQGIEECTKYLNSVVEHVWDNVRDLLRGLERQSTVEALVKNHEALCVDNDVWHRTVRAVLSLHSDKEEAVREISERLFQNNAASVSTRIIIEMALCECPLGKGFKPGKTDLTKLLAYAAVMYQLGGNSDAIHYGAMAPEVRISPLGDVMFRTQFTDDVLHPFGMHYESGNLSRHASKYDTLYEQSEAYEKVEPVLNQEYVLAWKEEYGFGIDEARQYTDILEDYGLQLREPYYVIKRSELLAVMRNATGSDTQESLNKYLDALSFIPRANWDSVCNDFSKNDIWPWRFRRRLSCISRPMLQINNTSDPTFLIAPAFVRDGVNYLMTRGYDASLDEKFYRTKVMRRWIGARRNAEGHAFNDDVAEWMREMGWHAESNVKLTTILNKKLNDDYGDVDVLAWRSDKRRVLVIECKDLEFAKTHGEIARQLYEYRGEYDSRDRPDRLRRHLERADVLSRDAIGVAKYVGLEPTVTIEAHIVFRNPVPMWHSPSDSLKQIGFHIYRRDSIA